MRLGPAGGPRVTTVSTHSVHSHSAYTVILVLADCLEVLVCLRAVGEHGVTRRLSGGGPPPLITQGI